MASEVEFVDFYEVLGVPVDAPKKVILKAFRTRAVDVHPDKNPDPKAKDEFHKLTVARDALVDPEKRRKFDDELKKKKERELRFKAMDSERQAMRAALEAEERKSEAKSMHVQAMQRVSMKSQIAKLREANRSMRETFAGDAARKHRDALSAAATEARVAADEAARSHAAIDTDATIVVRWEPVSHVGIGLGGTVQDATNVLRSVWGAFGKIIDVVKVDTRKRRAMVIYNRAASANNAASGAAPTGFSVKRLKQTASASAASAASGASGASGASTTTPTSTPSLASSAKPTSEGRAPLFSPLKVNPKGAASTPLNPSRKRPAPLFMSPVATGGAFKKQEADTMARLLQAAKRRKDEGK